MDTYAEQRRQMVERQIVARGIRDPIIVQAMQSVPRDLHCGPHDRGTPATP
jgi:hypothetical protein